MNGRNLAEALMDIAFRVFVGGVVLALVVGALIGGALMWWVR